jgi:hypothetical protein
MSNSNNVNPLITDSLAQNSASVVGSSPTVAMSFFYQAAGQAYAITMQNAASNQQNLNALNTPIVTNAVTAITNAGSGGK